MTLPSIPQPTAATRPHVVLVGPPGAGKSTIGRRLSRALNVGLVDSD
ncbi:MAG: shikimate kinase, partial [Corynebacterium casei]